GRAVVVIVPAGGSPARTGVPGAMKDRGMPVIAVIAIAVIAIAVIPVAVIAIAAVPDAAIAATAKATASAKVTASAAKATATAAAAKATATVDEQRGGPACAVEASFQHRNVKGEGAALE